MFEKLWDCQSRSCEADKITIKTNELPSYYSTTSTFIKQK